MTAYVPLSERIARHSIPEPNSGCTLWLGHLNRDGYGRMAVNRRTVGAHRVAYEIEKGLIPEGLEVDHLCRNRGCINASHMELVTHRVNSLRGNGVSAVNAAKTACQRAGHAFTEDNTDFDKKGRRICRACRQERQRRVRADNLEIYRERERIRSRKRCGRPIDTPKKQGPVTHCRNGHPYDEINTYVYQRADGRPSRSCRACNRDAQRRLKERERGAR